jgi:tetratricopeptide (TPR) repeat protein
MKHIAMIVGMSLAVGCFMGFSGAQAPGKPAGTSPAVLLEKGIFTEETLGDLDEAIGIYRQIIEDAKTVKQYAAQAQLRLGMCYLKKGDRPAAVKEFRSLLAAYPREKRLVGLAKAELAKLTPAGAPDPAFLPLNRVVERTVYDDGAGKDFIIDFDTGALYTLTEEDKRSGIRPQDLWGRGFDAGAETAARGPGLYCGDIIVIPLASERWEQITVDGIRDDIQMGKPGTPVVMSALPPLPRSYVFRTREGSIGALQIVDLVNTPPRHIKIRYKLLEYSPAPVADPTPRVLSTSPRPLSNDVDPSLDKLTVTFDRPMMDKSWSWTGGGETYPEAAGGISYDEKRTTCTFPVKLQPGKAYWVGINSPSHKHFKTPDRTPAKWYVILFATKGVDGKPTPLPADMAARASRINAAAQAPAAQILSAGAGSDEDLLGEARQVGQALLGFLKAGQVEQAFTLTTPQYRQDHPKSFGELASRMDYSASTVADVLASQDSACVVLSGVVVKGRQASMSIGLGLRRYGRRFLIRDIDALPHDDARKEFVAGFRNSLFSAAPMRREYVDPNYVRAAEELSSEAWRLWKERKLPEAEKKFKVAVALDPTDANAWNGLGWSQFNQGKREAAKEAFEKAVTIDPAATGSWNGLGWIAKAAGNTEEAIGNWKKALAAAPGATAALNGLASTYMELGQYGEAIKVYEQWLRFEADNEEAKAGLKRARAASDAARAAREAAQGWLKLLDGGQFDRSWSAMGASVRSRVAEDAWSQQVRAARAPLGAVKSRSVRSAVYTTSMPGAPDGQYVVIQYDTVFENKAEAVETVTPMRTEDGTWRVSGYYIK